MKKKNALIVIISSFLLLSIGINIFLLLNDKSTPWVCNNDEVKVTLEGIIYNNIEFRNGEQIDFEYDFDNLDYAELKSKYNIENIAGNGTEFEKARNLMNEFSARINHKSDFENQSDQNALDLLEYSLDNKKQGINCRAKAQILNEMCLSLNIYARKVWIMPNSVYDTECHVVNEIFDSKLNKWIMLDITQNNYWVDQDNIPLSILEIREKIGNQKFCTPIEPNEKTEDLNKIFNTHFDTYLYIAKNMVYMEYLKQYTVGESDEVYILFPKNIDTDYEKIISIESISASPIK